MTEKKQDQLFEEVYTQYFRDVYRYLLSLTRSESLAEELTQETFFKALENIHRFDGKCRIFVWLCEIGKNAYFSHCRKEKRFDRAAEMEELTAPDELEEKLFSKEEAFRIHRALHALEEPYKEVFSLRLFGELSFAQIAELFGKTESWARVTYHRARLKIKEDLS